MMDEETWQKKERKKQTQRINMIVGKATEEQWSVQ